MTDTLAAAAVAEAERIVAVANSVDRKLAEHIAPARQERIVAPVRPAARRDTHDVVLWAAAGVLLGLALVALLDRDA